VARELSGLKSNIGRNAAVGDKGAEPGLYRAVMRRVAGGVSVVLTGSPVALAGMTVNSLVSVSLDPPLLLFCARLRSVTAAAVIENGLFSVNLLGEDQHRIARHFASGRLEPATLRIGDDRDHVWLEDTVASLLCMVQDVHRAGDHDIIVGRIGRIIENPSPPLPLIYHEGRYRSLGPAGEDVAIS
jgi:3-hydroxy-9,10-secoandrosta-1,3,5(10)-triene-9,17-dione monooxygenase reductase component